MLQKDEFQLVDNTRASCKVDDQDYIISPSRSTWHGNHTQYLLALDDLQSFDSKCFPGLDLRITLLKESKAELLSQYVNDRAFQWIVDKTFTQELTQLKEDLDSDIKVWNVLTKLSWMKIWFDQVAKKDAQRGGSLICRPKDDASKEHEDSRKVAENLQAVEMVSAQSKQTKEDNRVELPQMGEFGRQTRRSSEITI